jgi:hypothetical protein
VVPWPMASKGISNRIGSNSLSAHGPNLSTVIRFSRCECNDGNSGNYTISIVTYEQRKGKCFPSKSS